MVTSKKRLTVAMVSTALEAKNGNIAAAAREIGFSRKSIYQFLERNPELYALVEDARETRIDNAEDKLGEAVERGEAWAVCFTLKTLGRNRGYVERLESDNRGTVEVIVRYEERSGTTKKD